jgi:uncharacterized protein YndB with AHSA1/START domain
MSKKSNKKSAKKKDSKKKPVKKHAAKKSPAKASKPTKKKASKKVAAKKPLKKSVANKKVATKPTAKKTAKKVAPKKAVKPVKKAPVQKPIKATKPATTPKSPVKPVKPEPKAQAVKSKPAPATENVQEEPKIVRIVKPMPKGEPLPTGKKSILIDIKTGPEPAGKFELEYVIHASSQILFEFLTTPSGLSEWFCDDVNIRNGVYSFKWEDNEQNARVVKLVEEKLVRFQWLDKHDNSYFEFRIDRDDLTNDISLIISDFAESADEKNSSTLLWNSQIEKLFHVLGAYF